MVQVMRAHAIIADDLLRAAVTSLMAAELHLFTGNPALTPVMVPGDFTEADFTGYALATLTWDAAAVDLAGQPILRSHPATFSASSPLTVNNTITGWWLENPLTNAVIAAGNFDAPVLVTIPLQSFEVEMKLNGIVFNGGASAS